MLFLLFSVKLAVEILLSCSPAEDQLWGQRNSVFSHSSPTPCCLVPDSEYSLTAAKTCFCSFSCDWCYWSLNPVRHRILSNHNLSEGLALPSRFLWGLQKSVSLWLKCIGRSWRVWHSLGRYKHAKIIAWKGVGWDNPVCRCRWFP